MEEDKPSKPGDKAHQHQELGLDLRTKERRTWMALINRDVPYGDDTHSGEAAHQVSSTRA